MILQCFNVHLLADSLPRNRGVFRLDAPDVVFGVRCKDQNGSIPVANVFTHCGGERVVDVCAVVVLLWNVAKCVGRQVPGRTDAWDFDHVVSEIITAERAVSRERNLSVEVYVV